MRVRVKVKVDVSVRWAVVYGALAVHNCLKLWEALMDSFTSVVLFGAALMPVSWLTTPTNTETWSHWSSGLPRIRARGSIPLTGP